VKIPKVDSDIRVCRLVEFRITGILRTIQYGASNVERQDRMIARQKTGFRMEKPPLKLSAPGLRTA
jgi:hypothetical protein